jgi:hypothetical protein
MMDIFTIHFSVEFESHKGYFNLAEIEEISTISEIEVIVEKVAK